MADSQWKKLTATAVGDGNFCKVHDVRRCASIEKLNEAFSIVSLQNKLDKMGRDGGGLEMIEPHADEFTAFGTYIGKWTFGKMGEYRGEWDNGQAHGLGVRVSREWKYAGTWLRGKQCGVGIYTVMRPLRKSNRVVEECEYGGQWKSGARHGFGTERDNHGSFAGIWHEGQRGRLGVFHADAGWSYAGTFIRELFGGLGRETFIDGALYEGEFDMGKRSGVGVKTTASHDMMGIALLGSRERTYSGEWVADKREGYGVEVLHNGTTYVGQFKNNRRHGLGKLDEAMHDPPRKTIGLFDGGNFDYTKRVKESKVAAVESKALAAAHDAMAAQNEALEFVKIAEEKAAAADAILQRTRDVVSEFNAKYEIFEQYKHDNISPETAAAFPIRANAISKASQTGGPPRKDRRQAVLTPDHLNAADKITIHHRRVPEVDAGTDAGTNYDVPKHKLQRFNSLKVRVQRGRDKHPNGRPSNPDAEAIDFRLILLKLFVVVLVIIVLGKAVYEE